MNTFRGDFKLATLGDLDSLCRLVARRSLDVLDLLDNLVALEDFAENDVPSVEPPMKRISNQLIPSTYFSSKGKAR